jgi:FixJ family two-component response regulator
MGTSRTIVIVDDDEAARHSAEQLIERAGHRVLAFATGVAFLAAQLPDHLDCVLLGARMMGPNGLDVLRVVAERDDAPPVLLLNGDGDLRLVVEAMRFGAFDLIERPYAPAALLAGTEGVAEEIDRSLSAARMIVLCAYPLYVSRAVSLLEGRREIAGHDDVVDILSRPFPGHDRLTPRERATLAEILKGASSKQAARALGISPRTVEFHRTNIMRKLKARNVVELVGIVLGTG